MTKSLTSTAIVRRAGFAVMPAMALVLGLTSFAGSSFAYTQEQKMACMPDAFRLCSSEIPNIPGITACMRRQKANLSPACKAVFDKNLTTVAEKTQAR